MISSFHQNQNANLIPIRLERHRNQINFLFSLCPSARGSRSYPPGHQAAGKRQQSNAHETKSLLAQMEKSFGRGYGTQASYFREQEMIGSAVGLSGARASEATEDEVNDAGRSSR